MKRMFTLLMAMGMVLGFTVSSQAILFDRGGGMIYDDDLNITWLQDANYAHTSGFDADGLMTWNEAMDWAANLVYGGFDDWRLPTALNRDGSGPCDGINCLGSEMGNLYYSSTGLWNFAGGPLSTSFIDGATGEYKTFQKLQPGDYWSGTEVVPYPNGAWGFNFGSGGQLMFDKDYSNNYAWAVRSGDVAAVPEPGSMLLLGSGLAGLAVFRKRFGRIHR